MSPEAQRVAIAEACGWIEVRPATCVQGQFTGIPPKGLFRDQLRTWLPDYLTDLNAMHKAEDALFGKCGWVHYSQVLLSGNIHATAAQRAEAFLRTLGKWTAAPGAK